MSMYKVSRTFSRLIVGCLILLLAGCANDQQQTTPSDELDKADLHGGLVNREDYIQQLTEISRASPKLYQQYDKTYNALIKWLNSGAEFAKLTEFGIQPSQMSGSDGKGNVKFTGYYTPVIEARLKPDGRFKYPLYAMPKRKGQARLPERSKIYKGIFHGKGLELAYSDSLIENFLMEVQGSAYVDFADGSPLNFFSYAGKNGHGYKSIGKVLIDRGEISLENMSMQAIRTWVEQRSEKEVIALLNHNPSFVFFKPQGPQPVKGASGIPLIGKASVAADRSLIAPGTTLLAEVPLLNDQGKFTGKYELRLMVALDVGGAIKGHHFDIYQGVGKHAGEQAGFYNHYGRVWVLTTPEDTMGKRLTQQSL